MSTRVGVVALGAVAVVILGCGGLELPSPDPEPVVLDEIVAEPEPVPPRDPIELDDRIDLVLERGLGDDGPVILQFSDWRCPHCYRAMPRIRLAASRHRAQLRFRSFPLAGLCNPTIEREDPVRCELALAAVCAHRTGQFDDFAARAEGEEGLVETLSGSGAFRDCMEHDDTAAIVRDQAQSGADLGLRGTPTFYVRIDGSWYEPGSVDDVLRLLENGG